VILYAKDNCHLIIVYNAKFQNPIYISHTEGSTLLLLRDIYIYQLSSTCVWND
jgi:hypothetical protein